MAPLDGPPGEATPSPGLWSSQRCRWLAGLDAGVCGALWVLFWLALHGRLSGSLWWSKFNVAASPFFGDRVFSAGLGRVTLAGAALLFVVYSILGAVLGRLTPAPPRWPRSLFVGLTGALLFHLLAQRWGWSLLNPFAPTWFTPQATLPAHLLFGLAMVRLGRRYLALMTAFGPLSIPPPGMQKQLQVEE